MHYNVKLNNQERFLREFEKILSDVINFPKTRIDLQWTNDVLQFALYFNTYSDANSYTLPDDFEDNIQLLIWAEWPEVNFTSTTMLHFVLFISRYKYVDNDDNRIWKRQYG